MSISIFDLFSIGIGPSSSHTVGPMKAAKKFVDGLNGKGPDVLSKTNRIKIELFGSLAYTGKGHGTDKAVLLGLEGESPETVDPDAVDGRNKQIIENKALSLLGQAPITFEESKDLLYHFHTRLPIHTNGMRFTAYDNNKHTLHSEVFYSIGGGFILDEKQAAGQAIGPAIDVAYPFTNCKTLLAHCEANGLTIKELMLANESAWRPHAEIEKQLHNIARVMRASIDKGCTTPGILPGGLGLPRRAPTLYKKLEAKGRPSSHEKIDSLEWLNLYAIAVNEENAGGGRIVTAPTNGASGLLPAVLYYYLHFYSQAKEADIIDFLLTAGAIGILYKKGASLSGAEVGCQGEVGVACSMAAGALTAVLGGSIYQIENAAEIAMEHNLGLTCDPINGLVQIPCIERNAMGAVKAVNAARLALLGNGHHYVSLDKVIATMKQTGLDMMSIYKETAQGGLAVNLPEC